MRMLLSADWLMGDTECQSHIFGDQFPVQFSRLASHKPLSHFRDEKTEAQ